MFRIGHQTGADISDGGMKYGSRVGGLNIIQGAYASCPRKKRFFLKPNAN
jgi:hypothetical protein